MADHDDVLTMNRALGAGRRATTDRGLADALVRQRPSDTPEQLLAQYEQRWRTDVRNALPPGLRHNLHAIDAGLGFAAGLVRGLSQLDPRTGQALDSRLARRDDRLVFVAGWMCGVPQGVGTAIADNLQGLVDMALMSLRFAAFGLVEAWRHHRAPVKHNRAVIERNQQIDAAVQGLVEFIVHLHGDQPFLLRAGFELGEAAPLAAERWLTQDWLRRTPFEMGEAVGRVEGNLVTQVVLAIVLSEAQIARLTSFAGRTLRASRFGAKVVAILERVPGLRRLVRTAEAVPAVPGGRALGNAPVAIPGDNVRPPAPSLPPAASPPAVAARAAARAVPRTIAQRVDEYFVTQLRKHGGKLVDTPATREAVAGIFRRTLDAGEFAIPVDRRAATRELYHLERLLKDTSIRRVTPVPSSSAGRTPDFRVELLDGTVESAEVTALTGASRGRSLDLRRIREIIGTVPGRTFEEWLAKGTRPWEMGDVSAAIRRKVIRGQLGSRGRLCISLVNSGNSAAVDGRLAVEVANFVAAMDASRTAALRRIEFDVIERAPEGLRRRIVTFVRQASGVFLPVP